MLNAGMRSRQLVRITKPNMNTMLSGGQRIFRVLAGVGATESQVVISHKIGEGVVGAVVVKNASLQLGERRALGRVDGHDDVSARGALGGVSRAAVVAVAVVVRTSEDGR